MSEEDKASPAAAEAKSPSQMKLVIVGAVALFVALVAAQVAVPLINGVIAGGSHGEEAATAEQDAEHGKDAEHAAATPAAPALYTALDPPFVVSFDDEDGARYVQLTLQAMARDARIIDAVKQHSPAIRNSVLFKLSGYELEVLGTQEGKEQLRHDLLGATNEILAKNGVQHGVEELYFTSLVIQ